MKVVVWQNRKRIDRTNVKKYEMEHDQITFYYYDGFKETIEINNRTTELMINKVD